MDLRELESYRLTDAIKFNDQLNPALWDKNEQLKPEVRDALLRIAADFKEFLGIDVEVKDITISGSNAAYTYTPHSDIDLHLVADLPKGDVSEVYRELFDSKKYQYNDQHNFKIGGYDVELYVQNANEPVVSKGVYSVLNNDWIKVPARRKPEVDDISVRSKYEDLGHRIDSAIESNDPARLEAIAQKVRSMRQAGLERTGEFSPENLAFKVLRSNGTLDKLRQARMSAKDAEMSLAEKAEKRVTYGFKTDFQDPEKSKLIDLLNMFVKHCAAELKLKSAPEMIITDDPEWSKKIGTFGRFLPDDDTLTVSIINRHPLDIMRTIAHELTHHKQHETVGIPDGAGATGSAHEDQANAFAGRIMRRFVQKHPNLFKENPITESSGYIPVNDTEAQDPRYKMALTVDIKPGEPQRQAAKLGWSVDPAGNPPLLMDQLRKEWRIIKESQELDEVAMSPSSLSQWARSPEAQRMTAGFEAELIFTDTIDPDSYVDSEPDYSDDPITDSISGIIEFFSENGMNSSRELDRLEEKLQQEYESWRDDEIWGEFNDNKRDVVKAYMEENDWKVNQEDYISDELRKSNFSEEEIAFIFTKIAQGAVDDDYRTAYEAARDKFMDSVTDEIRGHGNQVDAAYEEFYTDEIESGAYSENEWLQNNYRFMSEVEVEFNISWPFWTEAGDARQQGDDIAQSLSDAVGMPAIASQGYHGAPRKPGVWIVEPDSSLEPDGRDEAGLEVVSPPLPLPQTLDALKKVVLWAKQGHRAYTNESTGLHMNLSVPNQSSDTVDYVKMVLFLGDQHILEQFGREANTYCQSALDKIKLNLSQIRPELREASSEKGDAIDRALDLMRQSLSHMAAKDLRKSVGRGKYTSVHDHENYFEFRSPGNNYLEDQSLVDLQSTMLRCARALSIAADPNAERKEYGKKLYKLLTNPQFKTPVKDPQSGRTQLRTETSDEIMQLFARFAVGDLSNEEFKIRWLSTFIKSQHNQSLIRTYDFFDWHTGQVFGTIQSSDPWTAGEQAWAKLGSTLPPGTDSSNSSIRVKPATQPKFDVINAADNTLLGVFRADDMQAATRAAQEIYGPDTKFTVKAHVDTTPKAPLTRREKLAQRLMPQAAQQQQVQPEPKEPESDEIVQWHILDPDDSEILHTFNAPNRVRSAHAYALAWMQQQHPDAADQVRSGLDYVVQRSLEDL